MYTTVIFDLDGTLLDTSPGIAAAVRYVIKKLSLSPLDDAKMQQFISLSPIQVSFKRFCGVDDSVAQKCAEAFRTQYLQGDLFKASVYPGMEELLSGLKSKGFKLAVATYKRQDCADALLKRFGLHEYFDIVCGADNDNKLTKTDIMEKCCRALGSGVNECIMVGDSKHDASAAENLDMDFAAVTYGFGFKNEAEPKVYKSVFIASAPQELAKLFYAGNTTNE